ncbi:hypothetical protein AE0388_0496 [Brevibacterium linens]|uniref:Uncharacterized protein n=1 Tax=Brevibacterium linens TaxID=1703 RepID=A0A0B9AXG0_BRELN|nr:hypothetical protein AE0388_0496 [Brevibacterium linens]
MQNDKKLSILRDWTASKAIFESTDILTSVSFTALKVGKVRDVGFLAFVRYVVKGVFPYQSFKKPKK